MLDAILAYGAVFLAAAVPWLEVLIVVPAAILAGLDPWWTALAAFTGNFLPLLAIVHAGRWWPRRWTPRARPVPASGRARRGRQLADRYGVPGLALAGPLLIGAHLATILALACRAPRAAILAWMGAGLLLWTGLATVLTVLGASQWLPGAGG